MKRTKFLKYLKKYGCIQIREGSRHSIYVNPQNKSQSSVGRHKELSDLLCSKICKQLGIPDIKK